MKLTEDAKLDRIVKRMQTDVSVDAPEHAVKYAKDLFRTRLSESPGILRRIVAVLTADLAAGRPAFGERSASASKPRQLLFTAEGNAVDLRVQESGESRSLRGQILGDGFENAAVIVTSFGARAEGVVEADGEFAVDDLRAGRSEIAIRSSNAEIFIQVDL